MINRILCITSNFPRWHGDSTTPFVLNIAKDLIGLGWEVDVLAPHASGTAKKEIMEGIGVRRFQYLWPDTLETICYQGGALINLRRDKLNYLKLPFFICAQWLNVLTSLMHRKYDLLHSHWILPQGFSGAVAAKMMKKPHVVTVHGGDIFGLQNEVLQFLKRKVLEHADAVTVNSSVTEKAVAEIAPETKRVHRIPMGVSSNDSPQIDLVRAIRYQYRKGKGPLLVYVGRLVDEKGVEDLIRATDILSRTNSDVTAIIIGEGPDKGALEALSRSLNLSKRIYFLGWVAPEQVGCYMSAADIFVGPSRQAADGWIEAQGLTFIEAMIARTPVVATCVGGIVDAVKHEETGLLINERSPAEIASSVNRLAVDKPLRERLIINAYAHASCRFSRISSAKAFDALFKSLLTAKRSNHG